MRHNLHLIIYKLLEERSLKLPGLDKAMKKPGEVVAYRQPLSQMILFILRGVKALLVPIRADAVILRLPIDFSWKIVL